MSAASASLFMDESEGLVECLGENALQRCVVLRFVRSGAPDRGKLAFHLSLDKWRRLFHAERVERTYGQLAQHRSRSTAQMGEAGRHPLLWSFTPPARRVDHRPHRRQLKVERPGGVLLISLHHAATSEGCDESYDSFSDRRDAAVAPLPAPGDDEDFLRALHLPLAQPPFGAMHRVGHGREALAEI